MRRAAVMESDRACEGQASRGPPCSLQQSSLRRRALRKPSENYKVRRAGGEPGGKRKGAVTRMRAHRMSECGVEEDSKDQVRGPPRMKERREKENTHGVVGRAFCPRVSRLGLCVQPKGVHHPLSFPPSPLLRSATLTDVGPHRAQRTPLACTKETTTRRLHPDRGARRRAAHLTGVFCVQQRASGNEQIKEM